MRRAISTFLALSGLLSSGCATTLAHGLSHTPPPYVGTMVDAACIGLAPVEAMKGEPGALLLVPAAAVDLPLSMAADTVMLPVDLSH